MFGANFGDMIRGQILQAVEKTGQGAHMQQRGFPMGLRHSGDIAQFGQMGGDPNFHHYMDGYNGEMWN